MKVTPNFIVSFETHLSGIIESTWNRVLSQLTWDKFMKERPSSTKREYVAWLLTTAQIVPEGDGGNTRFDDLLAFNFFYENTNSGAGLRLTKNEIEDNQMASNPGMASMDYANKWANDIAASAAYYPQKQLMNMIANGKVNLGYDGVPFFSTAHPLNPTVGPSSGTYSNIISAVPINQNTGNYLTDLGSAQTSFANALAAVRSQQFINGVPRYLRPTVVLGGTALQYRLQQLVGANLLGQTENIFTQLGIEVVIDPLLNAEPNVYYLGVADAMNDELSPFIWSQREPYSLRSYSLMTESDLNRRDEFEWTYKGRNAAVYGHPYLFYRCEPT